jgi:hypothetical protein
MWNMRKVELDSCFRLVAGLAGVLFGVGANALDAQLASPILLAADRAGAGASPATRPATQTANPPMVAIPDLIVAGVQINNDRYSSPFAGGPSSAATIVVSGVSQPPSTDPRRRLLPGQCSADAGTVFKVFALVKNAGSVPASGTVTLAIGSTLQGQPRPFGKTSGPGLTQVQFDDITLMPGSYVLQAEVNSSDMRDTDAARKFFKWPLDVRCVKGLTAPTPLRSLTVPPSNTPSPGTAGTSPAGRGGIIVVKPAGSGAQ